MTEEDDAPELTMDTAYDLLSNSRRRFTLYYLSQHDGEVPLSEIAAQIAAWENEIEVEDLSDAQQKRTYVSLYQTHLPKLTDVGVIRFDRDRSVVELTDEADALAAYLPRTDTSQLWPLFYLVFAVVAAAVYALALYDVPVIGVLSPAVVGGLAVAGVGGLAVLHYLSEHRSAGAGFSQMVQE